MVLVEFGCTAMFSVNVNATRTQGHTYSGRKVTYVCVLADEETVVPKITRVM